VCARELHDIYYTIGGGRHQDNTYIAVAVTIAGPLSLILLGLVFIIIMALSKIKCGQQNSKPNIMRNTKRKNLVAVVTVGIYICIYILILDIMAVHIVRTSNHEYKPELSGRGLSLNLGATYSTLVCDFLFCTLFLAVPLGLIISMKIQTCCCPSKKSVRLCCKECKLEDHHHLISLIFPLLLVAPAMCIASHSGYILLAWVTQPSQSTTTLILYYFLSFYMFLICRMSYMLLSRVEDNVCRYACIRKSSGAPSNEQPELTDVNHEELSESDAQHTNGQNKNASIKIGIFWVNLGLGFIYLGVALIFTMAIYLIPLASEDLFDYLFNVIQFMIVVVSTQLAYKLLAGKRFSFKRVMRHVMSVADEYKKKYDPTSGPVHEEESKTIVERTGDFLTRKLLVPHMVMTAECNQRTRRREEDTQQE
jgi:hypothetical protein